MPKIITLGDVAAKHMADGEIVAVKGNEISIEEYNPHRPAYDMRLPINKMNFYYRTPPVHAEPTSESEFREKVAEANGGSIREFVPPVKNQSAGGVLVVVLIVLVIAVILTTNVRAFLPLAI